MKKAAAKQPNLATNIRILSVGPLEEDHAELSKILACAHWPLCPGSKWTMESSLTLSAAVAALESRKPPLVVCESDLGASTWRDLWKRVASLPDPPVVIVTSRLADECLWAEALNLGVYDVLAKPFHPVEVVRALSQAWLHRTYNQPRKNSLTAVGHPLPAHASSIAG